MRLGRRFLVNLCPMSESTGNKVHHVTAGALACFAEHSQETAGIHYSPVTLPPEFLDFAWSLDKNGQA